MPKPATITATITANVTDAVRVRAHVAAVKESKSLRKWAGEAIEARLAEKRTNLKDGPNLKAR